MMAVAVVLKNNLHCYIADSRHRIGLRGHRLRIRRLQPDYMVNGVLCDTATKVLSGDLLQRTVIPELSDNPDEPRRLSACGASRSAIADSYRVSHTPNNRLEFHQGSSLETDTVSGTAGALEGWQSTS